MDKDLAEQVADIAARHGLRQPGDHPRLTAACPPLRSCPSPQRDLGGQQPDWADLQAQVGWARGRGAAVHLDGARLWESASSLP
jgi:threonine aldolase